MKRIAHLAAGIAVVLCAATGTNASATTGGTFETEWPTRSQCEGTWSYDGTTVTVEGTTTDPNNDTEPAVCVFFMTYEAPNTNELYRATVGHFGPYAFLKAKNPKKLTVQACFTEHTQMDECGSFVTVWER
ncbi:hypothetical protein GCM10029976_087420 [Kribbella albertanoniae]|uniref:Secreted protein n=1 Tax=Kribbella albertanoniae TaxID=1266829 RepID=A0A4R4QI13_9ACTN|nr:hypothetical protein [Kribbella albertanoniae]TDC35284.1 hypothetical protein E1261_01775 [Kribbella albertanoniae]